MQMSIQNKELSYEGYMIKDQPILLQYSFCPQQSASVQDT